MSMGEEMQGSVVRNDIPPRPPVAEGFDWMDSREKMLAFMKRLMSDPDTQNRVSLGIHHCIGGQKTSLDGVFDIGFEDSIDQVLDDICQEVEEYFEENMLTGRQNFVLAVEGATEHSKKRRVAFKVRTLDKFNKSGTAERPDFEDFDGEPPTKAGFAGQQMRHTEVAYHTLVSHINSSQDHTREQMDDLRQENRQLRAENRALQKERQDVLDMQFRRNLEYEKMQREQARRDQMIQGAVVLAVSLVETFFRNRGSREAVDSIKNFFDALPNEQKAAIFAQLSPQHQNALADMLTKVMAPTPPEGGLQTIVKNVMESISSVEAPTGGPAPMHAPAVSPIPGMPPPGQMK